MINYRVIGGLILTISIGISGFLVYTNDRSNSPEKITKDPVPEQTDERFVDDTGPIKAHIPEVTDENAMTARISQELSADGFLLWKQYLAAAERFKQLELFSLSTIETRTSLAKAKDDLTALQERGKQNLFETMMLLVQLEGRLSSLELDATEQYAMLPVLETDIEPARAALEEVFILQIGMMDIADEYLDFMLVADYDTAATGSAIFKNNEEESQFKNYQQYIQEYQQELERSGDRAERVLENTD